MQIKKGYFYFIKDYYYEKVQDKELMQNKENGIKRPCFYCFKDSKVDELFWFIPISSKVRKYEEIYNNKIRKQIENNKKAKVDTLVFGEVNKENRVFLIQNMFPIIERFISDTYIRNNTFVKINYELQKEVELKANRVFALAKRGNKGLVFPNIVNIKNIMLKEINKENKIIEYILAKDKNYNKDEFKNIISSCNSKEEIKDYIEIIYKANNNIGQELFNIYERIDTIENLKEKVIKYFE